MKPNVRDIIIVVIVLLLFVIAAGVCFLPGISFDKTTTIATLVGTIPVVGTLLLSILNTRREFEKTLNEKSIDLFWKLVSNLEQARQHCPIEPSVWEELIARYEKSGSKGVVTNFADKYDRQLKNYQYACMSINALLYSYEDYLPRMTTQYVLLSSFSPFEAALVAKWHKDFIHKHQYQLNTLSKTLKPIIYEPQPIKTLAHGTDDARDRH